MARLIPLTLPSPKWERESMRTYPLIRNVSGFVGSA